MLEVWRRFVGLGLLLAAAGRPGSSSSPHSLRYFYMAMSEPGQELPLFTQVGYVDDQPITHYDSNIQKKLPVAPWMEKAGKDDAGYWDRGSQKLQYSESAFRIHLETLRGRYNQSHGGLHTLQYMVGCKVGADRRFQGGHSQYAYDGEDFITLDRETFTWTARTPQAQLTKSRWDHNRFFVKSKKNYLEEECVDWLQRYLDYGNETLLRTEAPTGRVAHKAKDVGLETLDCHLYGFYPKAIDVTWRKDGEVRDQDTFHGGVVPNSDGTYNTWRSIDIDPKERGLYQCHVEHDSLEKPLDLAWEEPASPLGLILGILGAILAFAVIVGLIIVLRQRRQNADKAAPGQRRRNDYELAPSAEPA